MQEEIISKAPKLRRSKKWSFDAWNAIKDVQVPLKVQDISQIPQFRQQIRTDLSQMGPGYEIVEVKTTQSEDRPKKSSAYARCKVEATMVDCIIDTGAGGVIISKNLLDKIGWHIEKPTKQRMAVADGRSSVPLGRIFDLPIQFGKLIIPSEALVVDTDTYDLLLGNDWITMSKAVLDMGRHQMTIQWKGREEYI